MPAYFGAIYPEYSNEYSIINSFVVSIGGFTSAITGGIIADKYEKKFPMIKALVCM